METNFDNLKALRAEALRCGAGSKAWIDFANTVIDSFPQIYDTAKQMNAEALRLHYADTAALNLDAALRDLVAQIDLYTDCMDGRIDREQLDAYVERAETLLDDLTLDYFHPVRQQPEKFDLIHHLRRQRQFSAKTFGPGSRSAGVIDHIRKELSEIEANPGDITEWVDVILLALDGAWRAGFEPEQIAQAIAAKQARNEARQWPDWRTADPGKAIEHIKEESSAAPAIVFYPAGSLGEPIEEVA